MVGIDTKKENSSADARDIPASCPAAIVDIEREVPGNTAESIWHAPIQMACPTLMESIRQVWINELGAPSPAASDLALRASTSHITIPPINSELPMMARLSRCLPMTFVNRKAGIAV